MLDDKHIIFDSTVSGIVFALIAAGTMFVLNSKLSIEYAEYGYAIIILGCDPTATMLRLAAIGVGLSSVGQIIRVISIIVFQYFHGKDEMRKTVTKEIRLRLGHTPQAIKDSLLESQKKRRFDPFFVWIQYSDPGQALREWGRTRRRYMYVGENWIIAIILGFILGCVITGESWQDYPYRELTITIWFALIVFLIIGLVLLIHHNKKAEETMISVYLAGIFSEELRTTFLNPLK